jgi:hypothetical protein
MVGFQVFTAGIMKMVILWNLEQCSLNVSEVLTVSIVRAMSKPCARNLVVIAPCAYPGSGNNRSHGWRAVNKRMKIQYRGYELYYLCQLLVNEIQKSFAK